MADGGVLPLIDEACDASLMGGERNSNARRLAKAYYTRKRLVYGGPLLRDIVRIELFLMDRTVTKQACRTRKTSPISYCATGLRDCVSSTLYDLQVHVDA